MYHGRAARRGLLLLSLETWAGQRGGKITGLKPESVSRETPEVISMVHMNPRSRDFRLK